MSIHSNSETSERMRVSVPRRSTVTHEKDISQKSEPLLKNGPQKSFNSRFALKKLSPAFISKKEKSSTASILGKELHGACIIEENALSNTQVCIFHVLKKY